MEKWKDIEGYEGLYQISNDGKVKSLARIINRNLKTHPTRTHSERILKPGLLKKGYHRLRLCKDGNGKMMQIHRLVAIHFIPNPNDYPMVLHRDNDPSNNSVENLYWGNNQMNMQQMVRDGRHKNKYTI
jgi:hypothetical protein